MQRGGKVQSSRLVAPSGEESENSRMGVPTDTLASASKGKSLQGRNRELRFFCERQKRLLDWERHSARVKFEKETMLFKKRALCMVDQPRRHFRPRQIEEDLEVMDLDRKEVPKSHFGRWPRQQRRPASGVVPCACEVDEEQVFESKARLNQEKKACRSAPQTRTAMLTDPLYRLSTHLPKLEAEFADLIKQHNGLRRCKVDYKVKDFLRRIDAFNREQKHGIQEGKLAKEDNAIEAAMKSLDADAEEDDDAAVLQGPVQVLDREKLVVNCPVGNVSPHIISIHPAMALSTLHRRSVVTSVKQCSLKRESHISDDVFEAPSSNNTRCSVTSAPQAPVKRAVLKVEFEQTIMLRMWEDFTKDMSVDTMKRLVAFAAKNKLNMVGGPKVFRSTSNKSAPSYLSDFKSASLIQKFITNLSSLDGVRYQDMT